MNCYIKYDVFRGESRERQMAIEDEDEQAREWDELYDEVVAVVQQFGIEDHQSTADAWVDDDNLGFRRQTIFIRNLDLLRPAVIESFKALLARFASWEIVVVVSVPGSEESWPDMGLTIRAHEIVDGLQRRYFPVEYRNLEYQGARPGTADD